MLRLDLFEEPGRIADVAGLQGGHALVVERLGRLIGDLIAPRQVGIRLASRQARPKEAAPSRPPIKVSAASRGNRRARWSIQLMSRCDAAARIILWGAL